MQFAGQLIKDPPGVARSIFEQVKAIRLEEIGPAIEAQLQDYQDKLRTPGPEQTYTVVRGGFDLVKAFFAIQQGIARITQWAQDGAFWLGRIRTLLKNFKNPDFHATFKQLSSAQKKSFLEDFEKAGPEVWKKLDGAPGMVRAWEACFTDKVVRSNTDKLTKVSRFLVNNPSAGATFKAEFNTTSAFRRGDFVDRTSRFDDLKRAYDPDGNFSGFTPQGINASSVPQSVYNDMAAEASAPQYLDGVINSGITVPQKVPAKDGYTLYKVVPKGGPGPSPVTPFWMKLDELNSYGTSANFEQKLGLPISSHSAKYDVYRIKLKPGQQVNIFESQIANTIENGYTTTGGAIQSLVLDRAKWTNPEIVPSAEIFPPSNL